MKIRSNSLLALAAVLVLVLTACGAGGGSLDGTSWSLASIDGAATLSGVTATAEFKDGKITGSGGCNSYGGTYDVNGDKLQIKDVISTLMACTDPEGVMEQETLFLGSLENSESFKLTGDRLEILTSDGKTLTFAANP
jgi:heat shock protein HslJ